MPKKKATRKTWYEKQFYDTRIPLLRSRLNSENQKKLDAMSWDQKRNVVDKLIKKGSMI